MAKSNPDKNFREKIDTNLFLHPAEKSFGKKKALLTIGFANICKKRKEDVIIVVFFICLQNLLKRKFKKRG